MTKTAIAIFVKTPALSPLKTRLAAGVGKAKAHEFYAHSLNAVQDVIKACKDLHPVWAVAEENGIDDPLWSDFERLHTRDGCLGARQYHIYTTLLQRFDRVILIGADAPQISPKLIGIALKALDEHDHIFGPAYDGGYYLMAGKAPIEQNIWTSIPWSAENTYSTFKDKLNGAVYELPILTDIDTIDDLSALKDEMPANMNDAQTRLLGWVKNII